MVRESKAEVKTATSCADEDKDKSVRVRVYYTHSDGDFLLKQYLKRGFSHCFLEINGMIIDPRFYYADIFESMGVYAHHTYQDVDIVRQETVRRTIWQPFTCVSMIKAFMGINKWYILTPYQLWSYLDGQQKET
jgi:hypothetical protein